MKYFTKAILSFALFLILNNAWGQVSITTTSGSYSQDFNSLPNTGSTTWLDNSTISNWYAQRTGSGTDIVANNGSSNVGNLYSYGTATDRALGSVGSGTAGNFAWGVKLRNNTTSTLQISLAYTGEQWRNSAAVAQTVSFYYKKSAADFSALNPNSNATWTNVSSLNFTSPITGGTAGALDGNNASNRVIFSTTTVTTLDPGEYIILKWDDPDHSGADHGLSIDDVTVSWDLLPTSLQLQHPISTNVSCGFTMDFGTQFIGTDTDLVFRILNTGSNDIDITSLTTLSAPYSYVSPPTLPITLAPTQFTDVTVRFSPAAAGTFTSSLTINYNDGSAKTCVVNLSGTGAVLPAGSDIIANPSFVYATNIPYINYQTTNITAAGIGTDCIEIAQFTIRDGGASAPDGDALPTILNNLNFSVLTCGAIRRIAIYDGTTEIQEVTPACNFANFTGLNLTAPDNGTKTFRVIASFNASPITDKSQIRLTITSATVGAGSSSFAASNAGGAQTSIAGDDNRLNVIADRLAFVQNTSNVGINTAMTPFPTVEARDANGNRDIDFVGTVSITSTGTLDASPKTATAVSGLATFNNIIHTAAATARTLTATAMGLLSATSNNFDVLNTTIFKPGDLMFIGYDNQSLAGQADDRISIVTLVPIQPSTKFIYANAVYEMFAPANVRTKRWYGCNNDADNNIEAWEITYNGASAIAAGSVICFDVPGSGGPDNFSINGVTSTDFSKAVAPNVTGGSANMSTSAPDPVFLMQGTFTNHGTYSTFTGSILGAIMQGGSWYSVSDDLSSIPSGNGRRRSRIPPEVECFAIQGGNTTGTAYGYYTGSRTGSQPTIISNLINFASNWNQGNGTTGNDIPATNCSNTFTVGGTGVAGRWTGSDNTNWFNCRNWENFSVPDATTDVTISTTATNNPTISSTAPNADLYAATFDGSLRVAECRNIDISRLTLIIEGNNTPPNRLDIHGNLTISGTGALDMDDATANPDGIINLFGNWNNTLGTASFLEGNGTVRFRGNNNQSITTAGGSETFYNIVLDKTGGNVSLNTTNALVSGTATFTAGILNASDATTARMEFLAGSNYTGASAASHVQGWVRKVGNTAFTFPVGSGGVYAPAGISAPSNATHHFTARYFNTSPHSLYNTGSLLSPLKNVSVCEYWQIDRTNGTSNVNVTLSYDNPRSCLTPDPAGLVVARWNGAAWASEGQSAQTGTTASGTITSNVVTSFSPFTLGNITINPLPVELLNFRGFVTTKGEAQLTWQVAAQINIRGYAVEKSLDNKTFQEIGFVEVKNTNTYNFFDNNFVALSYYRLRIVEADGSYRFSQVISLDKNVPRTAQLLIYPNPAGEQDEIKVMIGEREPKEILKTMVMSQSGKVLGEFLGNVEENEAYLSHLLAQKPKGMYIIYLHTENGETLTSKFVKR
ncbi:MAG: hypothetical protein OHK0045_23130 [Raineya sp.]